MALKRTLLLLQIFTTLDFSFMTLQCNLCTEIYAHKLHWWAINEKSQAVNICNAHKNRVIVILYFAFSLPPFKNTKNLNFKKMKKIAGDICTCVAKTTII